MSWSDYVWYTTENSNDQLARAGGKRGLSRIHREMHRRCCLR
ncbi:hypothetical protein [Hymenobacter lucidus]|nr:hypothetical protein [Hymenobacter lucidus]